MQEAAAFRRDTVECASDLGTMGLKTGSITLCSRTLEKLFAHSPLQAMSFSSRHSPFLRDILWIFSEMMYTRDLKDTVGSPYILAIVILKIN